jgi:hypothetical protein
MPSDLFSVKLKQHDCFACRKVVSYYLTLIFFESIAGWVPLCGPCSTQLIADAEAGQSLRAVVFDDMADGGGGPRRRAESQI